MRINRGLIVYKQYATLLVNGQKTRELRSYKTHIRGPIAIISESYALGVVLLEDVIGPFKPEELVEYYEYHRVPPEVIHKMFQGKDVRVRKMRPLYVFNPPLRVSVKRGARIRARIDLNVEDIVAGNI